ncbi:Fe-S protein [Microbacterium rhizophilus]|uniref:Fe-S protein n=1 Tax=Microbacterium rhizophilus TaxID=3138934 RepID=UPI0031EE6F4C
METLRDVVIVIHLLGFAILFGAWVVEAAARRYQPTRLMTLGMVIALVAGLALSAPWAVEDLDYMKIGIKLVILIVIGALLGIGTARARKGTPLPAWTFWLIGILTLANVAIAVIW